MAGVIWPKPQGNFVEVRQQVYAYERLKQEMVALKVSDIDSKRMLIRVEQGKGHKDRHAKLSPKLLELLCDWWRIARPQVWMFRSMDRSSLQSSSALRLAAPVISTTSARRRWLL
jgi:integrase